jgi:hypothetical protein
MNVQANPHVIHAWSLALRRRTTLFFFTPQGEVLTLQASLAVARPRKAHASCYDHSQDPSRRSR